MKDLYTEIKFKAKSTSKCQSGCAPAKKGGCGEPFFGSFKCSIQAECKNECICTVKVHCTKANNQGQEVGEKISKGASRSVPTKVKSSTEAKIKSATKKGIIINGNESKQEKARIRKDLI